MEQRKSKNSHSYLFLEPKFSFSEATKIISLLYILSKIIHEYTTYSYNHILPLFPFLVLNTMLTHSSEFCSFSLKIF